MEESEKNPSMEDYILGRLSAEDASKVEKMIEADTELAKQSKEEKAIQQGFQYHGQQLLLERLEGIRRKIEAEEESRKPRLKIGLNAFRIAASIAILALVAYGLYMFNVKESNLFAAFYAPYPISLIDRTINTPSEREIADQLYEEGRFQDAIPYLQELYQKEPKEALVLLALGISYLEINDLAKAKSTFYTLRNHENVLYKDLSIWYLSMVFLKEGQIEQVKQLLQPLVQDAKADKHKAARQLLKRLK